ncbi:MAG TPA: 2-dehydropantoate 2-reductase [Ktedonobacterales bacterium]|nr:2-dehydropantoate 2-reductase [Ktedonobacterales bacterium]
MRIAIWGAGAIGCFFAARLSERGHEVTLVGRAEQVAAINRDGLRVVSDDGVARVYRPLAATGIEQPPDLVLLTVKSQDVTVACEELRAQTGDAPMVVMQNGVEADGLAANALGRERVLGASLMCATDYLRPGEIAVHFIGWTILGEPFGLVRERTQVIRSVLDDVMPTYITHSMRDARWTKLISNLNNGLSAATGLTLPELAKSAAGRRLSVRLMKEGNRVARACGARLDHHYYGGGRRATADRGQARNASIIALLQSVVTTLVVVAPEAVASPVLALAGLSRFSRMPIHGSTWQSIERGKPTEMEYLNGAVVRLGAEHGVAAPWNARVVAAVREVEQTHHYLPLRELLAPARLSAVSTAGGSAR